MRSTNNPQVSGGATYATRDVYRWGTSSAVLGSWVPHSIGESSGVRKR
jgi:hypothetical protein